MLRLRGLRATVLVSALAGTAAWLSGGCSGPSGGALPETAPGLEAGAGDAGALDTGASDDAPANDATDASSTLGSPGTGAVFGDKIDILFDIDNSASMGDKQAYFAQAIPDLIARFVTPNCVDAAGTIHGTTDDSGHCAQGHPEFAPVRDIHLGIVSSSLGPRLGNMCQSTGAGSTLALPDGGLLSRHNDDRGELLDRASDPNDLANVAETALGDTGSMNFLDWFPGAAPDAGVTDPPTITSVGRLNSDFKSLVVGTHDFGCGIESQLESWYRFLVQPDPYDSLALAPPDGGSGPVAATWVGVDKTILAQRRAFLRPDSVVLVVVLSDENDSEIDLRSFSGSAYRFMDTTFDPPRGTSTCATNPEDPGCTSCAFGKNAGDSQCAMNGGRGVYSAINDWGYDLNLRHVHMKQKYGVDLQYPIQRYALGLSSPTVPDRDGEYPAGAKDYQGLTNLDCTNPLFAAALPDGTDVSAPALCKLPQGTRTADRVYYMHIGGVPHELLQVDPSMPDSPPKDTLTDADWVKILGADPLHLDVAGIDPHMIESYAPRPGLSTTVNDPISGREWITDSTTPLHVGLSVDREYACIFKLPQPRDCSLSDVVTQSSCDCSTVGLTPDELPAVCNATIPTHQDFAKAYPTIRELLLAKLMGKQGLVSSLCPIHTQDATGHDPLYGYRPAIHLLVNRLKPLLPPPPQ